ncbi:hypothetical protein B0H11DRAFT_1749398, partial [Mycena galericulata]
QNIMGMVFLTQEESTVPCYFLSSDVLADNFVTINATERDAAIASGQYVLLPTLQTYIYPTEMCGSIAVYRLYNSAKTSRNRRDSVPSPAAGMRTLGLRDTSYLWGSLARYVFLFFVRLRAEFL